MPLSVLRHMVRSFHSPILSSMHYKFYNVSPGLISALEYHFVIHLLQFIFVRPACFLP
jgi:hypothetical protein